MDQNSQRDLELELQKAKKQIENLTKENSFLRFSM